MFLACTGMRATEALSIRLKDVDLNADPIKVFIRGEYTKTNLSCFVFLTKEATNLLKSWLEYKYRNHRSSYRNKDGISVYEYIRPIRKSEDLIFAIYHNQSRRDLNLKTCISTSLYSLQTHLTGWDMEKEKMIINDER
jgi:integrase